MIKNFRFIIMANNEDNKSHEFHTENLRVCHITESLQQTREDLYSLQSMEKTQVFPFFNFPSGISRHSHPLSPSLNNNPGTFV